MKSIEVVAHCFAEKRPEFAKLLTAQLSSLELWPAKADIQVTVCTAKSDNLTMSVCKAFNNDWVEDSDYPVLETIEAAEHRWLFRRSIIRNRCAKESLADIVWFCDADYIFGQGCLDALAASDFKGLAYPKEVQIHRAHWLGDKEIARIEPGKLFEPDLSLFETKREKFAIGGLQIVDGDSARKYGYLDATKWVQPVPDAQDFLDTKEDKAFRNFMIEKCGPSTQLDLPNLYRFRHSASAFEPPENRLAQTAHKT